MGPPPPQQGPPSHITQGQPTPGHIPQQQGAPPQNCTSRTTESNRYAPGTSGSHGSFTYTNRIWCTRSSWSSSRPSTTDGTATTIYRSSRTFDAASCFEHSYFIPGINFLFRYPQELRPHRFCNRIKRCKVRKGPAVPTMQGMPQGPHIPGATDAISTINSYVSGIQRKYIGERRCETGNSRVDFLRLKDPSYIKIN